MSASSPWYIVDVAALFAALALGWAYFSRQRRLPLPPGPKPLPILGNLFDTPKEFSWIQYKEWAKQYGDVISLSIPVLGQVIVVLNSEAAIKRIVLGARASVFTNRPFIKIFEMTGVYDDNVVMTPYTQVWRDRRRVIDNYFRPAAIQSYHNIQGERAAIAMKHLLNDPEHFIERLRQYAGAVVLSIVYGYEVKEKDDPFVAMTDEVASLTEWAIFPGQLIVNTLPFLGRLPPRMFGSAFLRIHNRLRFLNKEIARAPWAWVKESMRLGTAGQSLACDVLNKLGEGDEEAEGVYREAFGVIYGAGADTTVAVLSTFLLAMTLYPEVQAKARAEIDACVGRDRLPTYNDHPNLPYTRAVLMETLRWKPVTPQGVPHVADEDVIWDGYLIPKGTMVIGNGWGILHDPDSYPEPEKFKPERFLTPEGNFLDDPLLEYAFGFGTRRCPGRFLAEATMWYFIASILSQFHITAEKTGDMDASDAFPGHGLIIHPLPFDCAIRPRDAQAKQLIDEL